MVWTDHSCVDIWLIKTCTIPGGFENKTTISSHKNASRMIRAATREDNRFSPSGSIVAEMPGNTGINSWIIFVHAIENLNLVQTWDCPIMNKY